MNKVILIGNLAADPESMTTQSGIMKCTLRIAVQRNFVNQQGVRETDFFNVICWRKTAEFCSRYLSKGRKIAVEGSLQTRSYDAQDGSKRYVTEVIADNVEFCDSRPTDGGRPRTDNPPPPPEPTNANTSGGFTEVDDDELPF